MIEDALKSTRLLHRLIVTVTFVTLIFALSLQADPRHERWRDAIDDLIAFDFTAYERFLEDKIEAARQAHLVPVQQAVSADLENRGHLIFNLDNLADAFANPAHVGKILVEDLNLSDITAATLTGLDSLDVLPLASDIQIAVPRHTDILGAVNTHLTHHGRAGQRVDAIQLTTQDHDFTADSFVPGPQMHGGFAFELVEPSTFTATPPFDVPLTFDLVSVPDTSFLAWLKAQPDLKDLIAFIGDKIAFLPALKDAPSGTRETHLGTLSKDFTEKIENASPAKQSVSILGTNVPGILVVFAAPLTLLALSYYLLQHIGHLRRLIRPDTAETFQDFSWLPMALPDDLQWSAGGITLSAWRAEAVLTLTLLPLTALWSLIWKLSTFNTVGLVTLASFLAATGILLVFSLRAVADIQKMRTEIARHAG